MGLIERRVASGGFSSGNQGLARGVKRITKWLKTLARKILTAVLGKTLEEIEIESLGRYEIISFDVFDTLVYRTVANPTDVFDIIAEGLGNPKFKTLRIEAEEKARRNTDAEEVTLAQIYKDLPYDVQKEVEAERSVCYANEEALSFFNAIKGLGKRVVVISDMYLPASIISTILLNCGYNLDDVNIYVSSEYGLTKRSGNLFKEVAEREGIETSRILHIGDNIRTDYIGARKAGVKGIVYKGRGMS